MKAKRSIRVIHNAPGKKGKQEYREFRTPEEAMAYMERNGADKHRLASVKEFGFRYGRNWSQK